MRNFFRFLVSPFLSFSLLMSAALAPKRSEAIVALATGNPAIAAVGAVIMASGGAVIASSVIDPPEFGNRRMFRSGFGLLFAGLLILDETAEGTVTVRFQELTELRAQRCGVSEAEREVYNGELAELNVITQDLAEELSSPTWGGAPVPPAAAFDLARPMVEQLSAETRAVLDHCFE